MHSVTSQHAPVASPVQPALHTQSSELTSHAVQTEPSPKKPELHTQSFASLAVLSVELASHAVQALPSAKYPELHSPQLKDPTMLVHGAFSEQVSRPRAHSSKSAQLVPLPL